MRSAYTKVLLAAAACGLMLLGGCATTVEMGPGYYRYNSHLVDRNQPVVASREPSVLYNVP